MNNAKVCYTRCSLVAFAEQRQLPPESNKWAEQSVFGDPNPRANQAEL